MACERGDRPPDSPRGHRRTRSTKTVGHYILGRSLGEGERGKVRLGIHILTSETVAVKVLEKDKLSEGDIARTAGEVFFMKLLSHPHVLRLYEVLETSRKMYLVSEFAAGGELFDFIVSRGRLEESEALRLFQQLLAGVEAIHSASVAHRGLQPQSILLDERGDVKITDFGLSRTYAGGQLLSTACGSPYYAAPEMLAREEYDPLLCDLWSCGVILYTMVCGRLPFDDPSVAVMYQKIRSAEYNMPTSLFSEGLRHLLGGLLSADPALRPSIEAIRGHPWYQSGPEAALCLPGDLEEELLEELDRLGFPRDYAAKCLLTKKHNHVTTTYHLLRQRRYRRANPRSPAQTDSAEEAADLQSVLSGRPMSSVTLSCPVDGEDSNEPLSPLSESSHKWSPLGGRRVSSPKRHRSPTTSPKYCQQSELITSHQMMPAEPSKPSSKQQQAESESRPPAAETAACEFPSSVGSGGQCKAASAAEDECVPLGLSQPARALRSVIRRGDGLEPPEGSSTACRDSVREHEIPTTSNARLSNNDAATAASDNVHVHEEDAAKQELRADTAKCGLSEQPADTARSALDSTQEKIARDSSKASKQNVISHGNIHILDKVIPKKIRGIDDDDDSRVNQLTAMVKSLREQAARLEERHQEMNSRLDSPQFLRLTKRWREAIGGYNHSSGRGSSFRSPSPTISAAMEAELLAGMPVRRVHSN